MAAEKERFIFFKFDKSDTLQTSFTTYDFHGMSIQNTAGIEMLLRMLKEIRLDINESMRMRCKEIQKFFNVQSEQIRENVRCYSSCCFEDKNGFKKFLHCSERLINPDMQIINESKTETLTDSHIITFGTIDMMVVLPVPHLYWSSIFRAKLSCESRVKLDELGIRNIDLINIPTNRVKYATSVPGIRNGRIAGDTDVTQLAIEKPYFVLTMMQFPRQLIKHCHSKSCHFERRCLRKNHLMSLCKYLFNNPDKSVFNKETLFKNNERSDSRIEFFLTFSNHFQGLLKAEFDSLNEVNDYLTELRASARENLLEETASLVGVNSLFFITNSSEKTEALPEVNKITFLLLIKTRGDAGSVYYSDEEICLSIRNILKNKIKDIVNIEEISTYNRPFYWDIMISLETVHVLELLNCIIQEIRPHENVAHVITIPMWKNSLEKKEQKSITKEKIVCQNLKERMQNSYRKIKDLNEYAIRMWRRYNKIIPVFKGCVTSNPDSLAYRIYNVKFDVEWILGHLIQLEGGWSAHYLNSYLRTFELLLRRLADIYKHLMLLSRYNKNAEKLLLFTDPSEFSDLTDTYKIDVFYELRQNSALRANEIKQFIWRELRDIHTISQQLKEIISDLISEYNDKKEGAQASLLTTPHLRMGQRTGVIDLYTEALNELYTDYCGKYQFDVKNGSRPQLWNGLINPSSGRDFSVRSEYQVLYLPVDVKLQIHGRLSLMAHEAAHFVLWCLNNRPKYYLSMSDPNVFSDPKTAAKMEIEMSDWVRERWNEFRRIWNSWIKRTKSSILRTVRKSKLRDQLLLHLSDVAKKKPYHVEILTDIIAGLIAGPAFFKSFGLVYHFANPERTMTSNLTLKNVKSIYPHSTWIRVYLGLCIWQDSNLENKWLEKYWKFETYFRKFIARSETCLSLENPISAAHSFFHNQSNLNNRNEEGPFFKDINTYLIRAFFDKSQPPSILECLVQFLTETFGPDFMFFGEDGGLWDYVNCDRVSMKCSDIAHRLFFGDEIVMNELLRHIAAASIMWPIQRPAIPTGRILHSLFYSSGTGEGG